jgi:hypothetical protein
MTRAQEQELVKKVEGLLKDWESLPALKEDIFSKGLRAEMCVQKVATLV